MMMIDDIESRLQVDQVEKSELVTCRRGRRDSDAEGDERKLRFREGDSNALGDEDGDGDDDEKDEGEYEWPVKEFQLKIPVNIYAIHSGHLYFFKYLCLHCIPI